MAFGFSDDFRASFSISSVTGHELISKRGETCWTYAVCIDRIHESGNFAMYAPVWSVQNYTKLFKIQSSVCQLNDDDYDILFITSYVQKGSFFLESLNMFVVFLMQSGLINKKVRDSVYMPRSIRNTTDVSDGYFVFTLNHLRIAFYILFVGHGVSFLLFLCEVLYHFRLRYV
jgi:hypothetical protein